jgi:endonuclease/exonuclease/phosphatase (EEP) superfamily protein YafD
MSNSFSLLTFNCFGGYLPGTSRRLLALANELEHRSDQVVCLQEIQLHSYQRLFQKACGSYIYQIYEPYVQCPKGGLLTLSRTPIVNRQFIPYAERGLWYTPMIMDRLLYKGMLITQLEWEKLPIIVINTHLLANYFGDWNRHGKYSQIEEQQLRQVADTVQIQLPETIVIVAGDFNIPRGSWLYHDFLTRSGLSDPLAGDTRPTHRPPVGIPARYALPLDYVLVRIPANLSLTVDCDLCLSNKLWQNNRHQSYLSDHNGIYIRITKNLNRGGKLYGN